MIGWQCPGCGQTYSPFVERCGNCRPQTIYSTTTTPLWRQPYWPMTPSPTSRPLSPLPENTCG